MAQYAIVKHKTKAQTCASYASRVASGGASLYFHFGNPVSWATVPGGSYNDTTPPSPKDSLLNEKQVWDGIIGLKKITSSDIKRGIKRLNWTMGDYYDMYRDDYDGTTVTGVSLVGEYTNTKPLSLARSNNLVLVDDEGTYKLYRCIDNRSSTTGNPLQSTTKPTFTTDSITTLSDGYKWKFVGELSSTDVDDYLTAGHCPIPTTLAAATLSGGASSVVMTSRGEGYTSTPTLTLKGDGTGMTLGTPVVVSGRIVYIPVTNPGTGYTYATVTVSGGGTPTTTATAKVIIAPKGGFNGSVDDELEANFLVVRVNNINTDEYFPTRGNAPVVYATNGVTDLKYRVIGLVQDPYNYGTTNIATASLLKNFTEYKYNSSIGSFAYGDLLTTAESGINNPIATVSSVRQDTQSVVNTISFNAATAVNGSTNILTYVGHGFVTGDAVLYNNNSGTSIGGLTTGLTYYVIKIGVDTIKLASSSANATLGSAIAITPGIGSGQTLTQTVVQSYVGLLRTTEQLIQNNPLTAGRLLTKTDSSAAAYLGPYVTFNGSSSGVVGVGSDLITIPSHPFKTGDRVTYSSGVGTTILSTGGAIVSGSTYYIIRASTNELKLATTLANANAGVAIDITGVGSGTTHTLTYTGTDTVTDPTVEKYTGKFIFTEYRNAVTRVTTKEKFRFVLEF